MMPKLAKNIFIICCLQAMLLFINKNSKAQTIKYSSKNVFTNNPDGLQLVGNIGGYHHLVGFIYNSYPAVYIFDNELLFRKKIEVPVKIPDKSQVFLIPFHDFYYLYVHPRSGTRYFLWKIFNDGNVVDFTAPFKKLLLSQLHNIKLGFQLIENQKQLCMIYKTDITNVEKNTMMIVRTDTLLNVLSEKKIVYNFNHDDEKLLQQVWLEGGDLLILKTTRSQTSLQLMKVNITNGHSITNTFYSSGYFYSQAGFNYNVADSTITVFSLLTEPGWSDVKRLVFISRLDNMLIEQTPFTILRSQFLKNEGTSFILTDQSRWMRFKAARGRTNYSGDVRFSLLDKKFKIVGDSVILNNKNAYTVREDQFNRFSVNNNDHLLVSQRFFKKANGLLMVSSNSGKPVFTNIRVNNRNEYLLSQSVFISPRSVVIPYTHKRESGLVKITIN